LEGDDSLFNKDTKRRAEILGIPDDYPFGGIRKFKNATAEQIKTLIDENFLAPSDTQNDSPTAKEFLEFMEEYPEVKAHGYVVSPDRDDYRVTIEGLECPEFKLTEDSFGLYIDFIKLCRHADEFEIDSCLYSWWD
jgi:hypothetical protein